MSLVPGVQKAMSTRHRFGVTRLRAERLEGRRMLAGNVSASIDTDGFSERHLRLFGDASTNGISVTQVAPFTFEVVGVNRSGATQVNGSFGTSRFSNVTVLTSVQHYLGEYRNLTYFKGLFPDSTRDVPEARYSFCHFDVDLYEGTLACLRYFYDRMLPGGIMLSHDYGLLAGVEAAFTEFFADKPERVIELPTTQCMVVKL